MFQNKQLKVGLSECATNRYLLEKSRNDKVTFLNDDEDLYLNDNTVPKKCS